MQLWPKKTSCAKKIASTRCGSCNHSNPYATKSSGVDFQSRADTISAYGGIPANTVGSGQAPRRLPREADPRR